MIQSKQVRRERHTQDAEMNDDKEMQADEMDNKMHTKCTANRGNQLNIHVDD